MSSIQRPTGQFFTHVQLSPSLSCPVHWQTLPVLVSLLESIHWLHPPAPTLVYPLVTGGIVSPSPFLLPEKPGLYTATKLVYIQSLQNLEDLVPTYPLIQTLNFLLNHTWALSIPTTYQGLSYIKAFILAVPYA